VSETGDKSIFAVRVIERIVRYQVQFLLVGVSEGNCTGRPAIRKLLLHQERIAWHGIERTSI